MESRPKRKYRRRGIAAGQQAGGATNPVASTVTERRARTRGDGCLGGLTWAEFIREINEGVEYFWSRPHRQNLPRPGFNDPVFYRPKD
jgi:hypothetical protein